MDLSLKLEVDIREKPNCTDPETLALELLHGHTKATMFVPL